MADAPITVVKIGGSTLGRHDTTLDDIAALHGEGRQFVVHGGGATITEWLAKHGVESRFVRGLRVTDERALEVVVAVLGGLVNKQLVAELQARGARAIGLTGADGAILRARRYDPELGFVGEITAVDANALRGLVDGGGVVVLAPIAVEVEGEALRPQLLNVNADTVAGEVAVGLAADRLVLLSDVPGVSDASGTVRPTLSKDDAHELVSSGVIAEGMVPKVNAALRAASFGVTASIVDGREPGALRRALAGEAIGTRIG